MKIEQNDELTFLIKKYCDADIWDFLEVHKWLVLRTQLFELSEYVPPQIPASFGSSMSMMGHGSSMSMMGQWDALHNSPHLQSGVGAVGTVYVVSTAGNTMLDGCNHWGIGDGIIFTTGKWMKIAATTTASYGGGNWGGSASGGAGAGGGGHVYHSTNGTNWTFGNPNSAGGSNTSFAYGGGGSGSSYVYQQSSYKIYQISFKDKQDSMLFKLRWM